MSSRAYVDQPPLYCIRGGALKLITVNVFHLSIHGEVRSLYWCRGPRFGGALIREKYAESMTGAVAGQDSTNIVSNMIVITQILNEMLCILEDPRPGRDCVTNASSELVKADTALARMRYRRRSRKARNNYYGKQETRP